MLAPRRLSAIFASTALGVTAVVSATATDSTLPVPERVSTYYLNANDICGPMTGRAANPAIDRKIGDLRQTLMLTASGNDILRETPVDETGPIWVCIHDMSRTIEIKNDDGTIDSVTIGGGQYGQYVMKNGILDLNTHIAGHPLTPAQIHGTALHELRHSGQHIVTQNLRFETPSEARQAAYIQEADAWARTLLVSWELKYAGHPEIWNHWADPANYAPGYICYANLARAFEDAIDSGAGRAGATRAAFRAWFDNKLLLRSYINQGNFQWGLQQTNDRLAAGLPLDLTPPPTKPKPTGPAKPRIKLSCDQQTNTEPGFELPTPAMEVAHNVLGRLPAYRTNYMEEAGGIRNILSHTTKEAATLRP